MTYRVKSDVETYEIGRQLAEKLTILNKKRAYIAMRGEMGVGKTVLTRGFVSHFGRANVKSPTYTIVNEYKLPSTRVYHFDLYRIEDGDDLESIGYHDYVESEAYCIVEWSERVPEYIPDDAITVTISRVAEDESARDIEIEGVTL
jgi:tRNA threonylcarbamoyladenosine biosynthesis protein TsaE